MKRFDWIVGGLLGLFLWIAPSLSSPMLAQDDAYMTPSRAKTIRAKNEAEVKAAEKRRAEKRAADEAKRLKAEQEYKAYQDEVNDWYNRREMKVTIEEMEDNLDQLDASSKSRESSNRSTKGGKYSQRLRRFSPDSDVIILNNVDKVYVLDDYRYDPWSDSYYGRDWDSGVNIIINNGYNWNWGYPYYSRYYSPYYYNPWRWGYYPWYTGWYDPWHYSHRPHFGWGVGISWGGFYSYIDFPYFHHNYYDGYWNGYYDGRYDGHRYQSRRPYNSYGRSSGGYYNRSYANSEYGRALGNGSRANVAETRGTRYYDRNSGNSRNTWSNRTDTPSSSWNRNSSTTRRDNSSSWSPRSSSSSSSRSSGTTSRSSSTSNSRSSGSKGRTR